MVCSAADAETLPTGWGVMPTPARPWPDARWADLPLAGVANTSWSPPPTRLFAGPLRRELDPAGRADARGSDDLLWDAIDAAAARDIVEALPDRLDAGMAAGGREFSGGQQQRLRLARALMADPEVLVLIDPTSAVDANTESRTAEGIARLRRGRATVVFSTSILLLRLADQVALVLDGTVAAEGAHESLMADPRYRSVVERWTAAG
ncbi:ABC transporter ATP-binding protein [Streptacidiphilus sp. 4-A2]|nr:ABC transporter ATP-binding protein [Streptacidiphilus sp. 4-A2]